MTPNDRGTVFEIISFPTKNNSAAYNTMRGAPNAAFGRLK